MGVTPLLVPRWECRSNCLPLKTVVVLAVVLLSTAAIFPLSVVAAFDPEQPVLPLFGYDLFETFRLEPPASEGPVDPSYVIGPRDEFVIHISGTVSEQHLRTVDHEGRIVLPKAGGVHIWGLTFDEARRLIRDKLLEYYAGVDITVGMGELRNIDVLVLGEVHTPGRYTVGSLATVLHALFNAGGIKPSGTQRDVRVIRDDTTVAVLDLYDLHFTGALTTDIRLGDGDVVYVPHVRTTAAIDGEVRRPAIYELKPGETLSDLVRFAGGFTPAADLARVRIERVDDPDASASYEVSLTVDGSPSDVNAPVTIHDGDRILVPTRVDVAARRTVHVSGAVRYPSRYVVSAGARLSDVIEQAGGLTDEAYLYGAVFTRKSVLEQQKQFIRDLVQAELQYIERERARLEEMPLTTDERERRWRALEHRANVVALMQSRAPQGRVILDVTADDTELPPAVAGLLLHDGDRLHVPVYPGTVLVAGAVHMPEALLFLPGQDAEYYLRQVGGPLREADIDGMYVIKANGRVETHYTGLTEIQAGDAIVVPYRAQGDASAGPTDADVEARQEDQR